MSYNLTLDAETHIRSPSPSNKGNVVALQVEKRCFIIQHCFVEYKYHTMFVLVSLPRPRERLKTLASQNFGKRKRWKINLLFDILVCGVAVNFDSSFVF